MQKTLHVDIQQWRSSQTVFMPSLSGTEDETGSAPLTNQGVLSLPSDFSAEERVHLRLQRLADIEMTLLKSLAYETLTEVHQSIKHKKAHLREKDQHIFGQGANTQAQTVLRTATQIIQTHAE